MSAPVPHRRRLGRRTRQFLKWLKAHQNGRLPRTIKQAMTAAGIPNGSQGYARKQIAESGVCSIFKTPGGGWGFHFNGQEKVLSPLGATVKRRFEEPHKLRPESVRGLPTDHSALVEGRTLFPSTVVDAHESPRLLVEGKNSRKLGSCVTKGPWRGMPIFHLTLEERATCPDSCSHWATCYGNGMQMARRHRHGPRMETLLQSELAGLQEKFPGGFVVRLHNLGDFYSVQYVDLWAAWLKCFPALHVFGYTARDPLTDEIGARVASLAGQRWDRFAVRQSSGVPLPRGATTINYIPRSARVPEGIVCPAQLNRTACCGTCGLCWAAAAKDETIVFVLHGNPKAGRPKGSGAARSGEKLIADTSVLAFRKVVKRRCEGCKKIFDSKRLEEYACPNCVTGQTPYAEIREAMLP